MKQVRFYVTFLDGTQDEAVASGMTVTEGMIVLDFGKESGEAGYNIRAIKSWYTEVVE